MSEETKEKGGNKTLNKIELGLTVLELALGSKTINKCLCGEYTDGTTRSIPDAIRGESKSPKQKRKEEKRQQEYEEWLYSDKPKKKKKKKKKGKKKKNKNKKPDNRYSYILF